MPIRAVCPTCGKVEEYEPDEEDKRAVRERGLAYVAFFHIDHVLVIYFDASFNIRRTTVFKTVRADTGPTMHVEDLVATVGAEGLALLLASLVSGGKAILASSSPDLTRKICSAVRSLLKPVEVAAEVAEDEEGLRAVADRPEGTVIMVDRSLLLSSPELPRHVAIIDLDAPVRLDREEKRALRAILKLIKRASKIKDEISKISFLRSRLLRLRVLLERSLKLLSQVKLIGEMDFRRRVDPKMTFEDLDLLYFLLERFKGVDVSRRILHGVEEFFL